MITTDPVEVDSVRPGLEGHGQLEMGSKEKLFLKKKAET